MMKKFGFALVALIGMSVFLAPAPANAQVRFGVAIGGPAYRYAAPPVYPVAPVPYGGYYAAPAYSYYPPVYVGPSYPYGYGFGYGYRGGYSRPYYNNFRGGGYRGGGYGRGGYRR